MENQGTTNEQLISELKNLRRRVSELEESEARLKGAERLLKESEQRFRLLYEYAPLGYQSLDENGCFLEVNKAWLDTLGYSHEEVIGKWFGDFLAPGYQDHFKINFPKFKEAGEIRGVEFDMLRKDGSPIRVAFDGRIGRDEQGRFKQTHCILHDITERKRAEEAIKGSEARVRMKLEAILSPEGDMGTLGLGDVIDVQAIQALMDDFFGLTNIGVGIIDLKGRVLVATGWQEICTKFHRAHPETCKYCVESDTELSGSLEEGSFKLYRCMNNMWDIATPIIVGGKHLGNLFLGQFLFEEESPDYEIFRAQARQYGFDEQEYLAALDRVPRWSRETVDRVMRFYAKMTRILSRLSFSNILLSRSIAEREHMVNSLRESEQRYRLLADNTSDVIWQTDLDLRFTYVNPAIARVTGYTVVEWIGTRLTEHCDEENFMKMAQVASEEISKGANSSGIIFEAVMLKKNKEPISVEIHGKVIFGENGLPIALQGVTRDVTKRKRAEEALRGSEEKYRTLFDESFDGLFITSAEGRILDMNKKGVAMFGYDTKEDILRLDLEKDVYAYPPDRKRILAMVNAQGTAEYEVVVKKKNGEEMITYCSLAAVRDENGVITSYRGIIRDITELAQVRLRLENERARLRTLVQTIPDLIWLKNPDGVYLTCNPRFERFFGAKEADIVGKTDYDFVDADLADFFREHDRKAMDAGKPSINEEWVTFADDGHSELLETIKMPMHNSEGNLVGVLGIARNITAARKAEEALQEANAYN